MAHHQHEHEKQHQGRKKADLQRDVERELDELEQQEAPQRHREGEEPPTASGPPGSAGGGVHAVGESGGGTPVGGLAGSNEGEGEPSVDKLEEAAGSGNFDQELEHEDEPPYAGPTGGAVGGSPAEKRARGGQTDRGLSPGQSPRGDSTIGSDPHLKKDDPEPRQKKAKKKNAE